MVRSVEVVNRLGAKVEGAGTAGSVPWERWLFAGVWFGAAVLGYAYLGRGWIPHSTDTPRWSTTRK